jgi:hypothetical protein
LGSPSSPAWPPALQPPAPCDDHVDLEGSQVSREGRVPLRVSRRPTVLDGDRPAFDPAELAQSIQTRLAQRVRPRVRGHVADPWNSQRCVGLARAGPGDQRQGHDPSTRGHRFTTPLRRSETRAGRRSSMNVMAWMGPARRVRTPHGSSGVAMSPKGIRTRCCRCSRSREARRPRSGRRPLR